MNPKLSIIIPCYNCEITLEESVNSCFSQGFDINSFEIVLVDDKSIDETVDIMSKLKRKYKNIKCFYHEENKGGGATRNTAVKNSNADVIFCLDSDDILPKGTMRKMYDYLKEKKCDGVTIHRSIKFNGNNIKSVQRIDISPYVNNPIPFNSLFSKSISVNPLYITFMFTKEAFKKINGYPESHGYDTQGFGWRFLCAGLIAYTCPDAEYFHRINFNESYFLREYNNGKSNYNWRNIFIEHYYIFNEKTLDFILRYDCKNFTRNIMADLINKDNILKSDFINEIGKQHQKLKIVLPPDIYIDRKSTRGYYYRIIYKISIKMNLIKKVSSKIYRHIYSALLSPLRKHIDKEIFKDVYREIKKEYINNKNTYDYSDFIMPQWQKNMNYIEEYFLNNFSFSFLNHKIIKETMFIYSFKFWKDTQKKFIKENLKEMLIRKILREFKIGKPMLNDAEYITSANNIHHLYHILKFLKETRTEILDFKKILEVGGGYGNFAKIFKTMNPGSTYIIIDIPIFSYIQALYLKIIFSKKSVNIINNNNIEIKEGLINLIPLDKKILPIIEKNIKNIDLFVSTWALSESNNNMQEYIKNVNYFNAKYLLLAYQKSSNVFSFAENVKETTNMYKKIFNQETEYTKDNFYLFSKRSN